ncbi:MAG TPA: hypothetical protein VFB74_33905 [Kribbellaceae bacterium]|nr:hypothetical protein [Kribbellaceae bacterium]
MTELYRWTLEKLDGDNPPTLIAQVSGEPGMVGAGIKGMAVELANRLNATLTAAGFPPVPEPAANGGGRRRGRPPKPTAPTSPVAVEPDLPDVPAAAPGLPSTDPFAKVHAGKPYEDAPF